MLVKIGLLGCLALHAPGEVWHEFGGQSADGLSGFGGGGPVRSCDERIQLSDETTWQRLSWRWRDHRIVLWERGSGPRTVVSVSRVIEQ